MPIQVNFNSGNPIFSPTTALQKTTTEIVNTPLPVEGAPSVWEKHTKPVF